MTKTEAIKTMTKRYNQHRALFLRGTPAQIKKAGADLQAAIDQVNKFNLKKQ